jgi:hypothetical protein
MNSMARKRARYLEVYSGGEKEGYLKVGEPWEAFLWQPN